MGLFDFLKGNKGNSESDERAVLRHAERVMDKRAMSPDRFASIEFLSKQGTPEAWRALLPRFNFVVDPSMTDREEKQYIYEAITTHADHAVEPLIEYLRTASSLTWPIKMLREILERESFVGELTDFLAGFDTGYEKNAERKAQVIAALEDEPDPRVAPAVLPFLEDFTEDVRFHAVRTLAAQGDEVARLPLVKLLVTDPSMRIRSTVVDGLVARGWEIAAEHRDAVQALLPALPRGPWVLGKDLKLTKRA